MKLKLRRADSGEDIQFQARKLVIAGFTGRNRQAVAAHIEELGRLGVTRPADIPALYPVSVSLLTTEPRITVASRETSGEVEPVLFCANGNSYVGVGSDHTARDLEAVDIVQSKEACPKVVGTEVIDLETAVEHWASLELRSRAGHRAELYQEGRAGDLLSIPELLEYMRASGHEVADGTVVFLGTLPLKSLDFVYGDRWSVKLAVPAGPTLTCSYDVEVTSHR